MGMEICTKRIRVYGIVQGVGFRPTVSRHAKAAGIAGTVSNKGPYVEIMAQGLAEQVEDFLAALRHHPPRRAVILKMDIRPVGDAPQYDGFSIIESEATRGEIYISPDIAICEDCKREMYDPSNRRYLHPFINCTCCGPRMTILDTLPYDRARTSMKEFPMCPACSKEYHRMTSRRYDAQPVCCNDCGPEVFLLGRGERGRAAIMEARRTILAGGIVAVKGIGGFHLCCDATNEQAVHLLRERKHRPRKAFAVMARDLAAAQRICDMSASQEELLTGHQKPILLLDRRQNEGALQSAADGDAGDLWRTSDGDRCRVEAADGDWQAGETRRAVMHGAQRLAPSVAPGNPRVGLMLPYAPIQLLLFDYDDGLIMPDYLVMTSGNISGAPICRDDEEAARELGPLSDCILTHDRKIRIRADDTVTDYFRDRPYMVRRSRGYAPLPVLLTGDYHGSVLAVGGELKNSCCLTRDGLCYLSPYIGDLEDLRTVRALRETIGRFEGLLETRPQAIVCDLHPGYHSVALAREMAEETAVPLLQVQHHYAHILSCMAENDYDGRVIGVSMDGTGYGTDGTIWGGELLAADMDGFRRAGHIVPFLQLGGDAAAREGWRIAMGMLYGLVAREDRARALELAETLGLAGRQQATVLLAMAERRLNAVVSTSAGRLFDGVSAILGLCRTSTYEGEASMTLQFHAEAWAATHRQQGGDDCRPIVEERSAESAQETHEAHESCAEDGRQANRCADAGGCWGTLQPESPVLLANGAVQMPTDQLVMDLINRRLAGEDVDVLAWRFHRRLAEQIAGAVDHLGRQEDLHVAALSGGVFQNRLLTELTVSLLESRGFRVLTHSLVPPNDGGIALGQAAYAMHALRRNIESGSQ